MSGDVRYHLWRLRRDLNALRRHILANRDKELLMADLTNLTNGVTALETAETAVSAEVATLKAGSDQAAVDALTARIGTVTTNLQGLVPPPAAPAEPTA